MPLYSYARYKLHSTLEYRTGASRKGWGNDGPCSSHGVSRWLLMFLDVFLSFWFVGLLGLPITKFLPGSSNHNEASYIY